VFYNTETELIFEIVNNLLHKVWGLINTTEPCLLGIIWHSVNGSPIQPWGQVQTGLWLTTLHSELRPHVPWQGFWHLELTQAWAGGHSAFVTHSGRQSGGTPRYPERHEHAGTLPTSRHWLFGPHGVGTQGLSVTIGSMGRAVFYWELLIKNVS